MATSDFGADSGAVPMTDATDWVHPVWRIPGVACGTTTRRHGGSLPPFDSFNTALHTGDDPDTVRAQRETLRVRIGASTLQFLDQVHGVQVLRADHESVRSVPVADALWTTAAGVALIIQTADCVPVLLASADGAVVAAAHAGWRGVAGNVVAALIGRLPVVPGQLHAWIGPAISGACYEVGGDVRTAMQDVVPVSLLDVACVPGRSPGKWWLDLPMIVSWQLAEAGVPKVAISDCGLCTYTDAARFYSYRRDGRTGRLASYILRAG